MCTENVSDRPERVSPLPPATEVGKSIRPDEAANFRERLLNRIDMAEDILLSRLGKLRELRNEAKFADEPAAKLGLKIIDELSSSHW